MRISLNWLKQYIDIKFSPEELAERLTMAGLEVESIQRLGEKFEKFVVGEILEVQKHPRADRLTICKVNVRENFIQIVCGAPNVAAGQKVPVGLVGAVVPRNQHDLEGKPFVLSHVKLRGEDSFGMICSPYELDLGDDKDGIMILAKNSKVGQPLAEHFGLNDVVMEIGITPNRPDAMSHIGIAREVGAFQKEKVRLPQIKVKECKKDIHRFASIKVEDKINCPRYTARVVMGITIGPSPAWMQNKLNAVGIRPINNIVDITNYVLMECGHPLHAFNYDKLSGHAIVVRSARGGEKLVTIDHKDRVLNEGNLIICDDSQVIAIAGVMGGANSEITNRTTNILIESAYFAPRSIRRASKYFGLSTDASQRFERGVDSNITVWAVNRATQLIQEIAGGEVLKNYIDIYSKKISPKKLDLRISKVNEVLGVSIDEKSIISLLGRLGITTTKGKSNSRRSPKISCQIPTFRPDIEREIDLIEEIARTYGYNKIPTETNGQIRFPETQKEENIEEHLRSLLVGRGLNEVVTNSMQERAIALLSSSDIVEIANPMSKDMSSLRTNLIPGMLAIVRNNIFHGTKDLRLFEFGKEYFHQQDKYAEIPNLLILLSGSAIPQSWDQKGRNVDIFDLRGEVEALIDKIFLDKIKYIPYSTTNALTEDGISIEIHGESIGFVGAVREEIKKKFEIDQDVYVAKVNLQRLSLQEAAHRKFKALSRYPSVTRDIAVIVDETISVGTIIQEIRNIGSFLLSSVELFDIFTGQQIEQGKKSCAFALDFLAEDHTLSQEEIDNIMQSIIHHLSQKLNASIRK